MMNLTERTQVNNRLVKTFLLGREKLKDPYYQLAAAGLAFFLLLAIVPIFILVSQLLGLFSVSLDSIKSWLDIDISIEGADILLSLLDYSPSNANSIFLAVTALWAASRAQFTLMRISNYTMSDGKSSGRGYLLDRLRSILTVTVTIFTIAFALVILVYGEVILEFVFGIIVGTDIAEKTWVLVRWPMAAALYFLMITYVYYALQSRRVPFRSIIPGSIFTSVGLLAVTLVFSMYTRISSGYDILYGSFSNVVALMFWFYFLSWVIFLGIILNRVWWESGDSSSAE